MNGNDVGLLVQRLGKTTSFEELQKCTSEVNDCDQLVEYLINVATGFEELGFLRSTGLILELIIMLAHSSGYPSKVEHIKAQQEVISAVTLFLNESIDEAGQLLDKAGETFVTFGDNLRNLNTCVMGADFFLQTGRYDDGITRALKALDIIEADNLEDEVVVTLIYKLARKIFEAPICNETTVFFARESRLFRELGHDGLIPCASSHLGCTLIKIGQIERGLEILVDSSGALWRYGIPDPNGDVRPFPEAFENAFWIARAFDLIGRDQEAEERYRKHPWWIDRPDFNRNKAELTTRLTELLIENDRYQEALDLLQPALQQESDEIESYLVLIWALSAKVYAILNQTQQSTLAVEVTRKRLASLMEIDEPGLRARLTLIEALLVSGFSQFEILEKELAQVRQDAEEVFKYTSRFIHLDRVEGDLAFIRGEMATALQSYKIALEKELAVPIDMRWEKYWETELKELPDFRKEIETRRLQTTRRERGVGTELHLRIAQAQVAIGEDAGKAFDEAIATARRRNRLSTLFYALVGKGSWLASQNKKEYIDYFEQAADVLEGLRADLKDEKLQIGTLTDKEIVYSYLLRAFILPPSNLTDALRIMERAKSRLLLDNMATELLPPPHQEDPKIMSRIRTLRQNIVREMRRQFTEGDSAESHWRLQNMKNQLASLYQEQYRTGNQQPYSAASPEEVCELTSGNIVVLHFFCDSTQIFVLPIASGTIEQPLVLDVSPEKVRDLLEVFRFERNTRVVCHSLMELYQCLLAPLERLVKGDTRLLIIPHSILHSVPFHALRRPDGRYLLEDVTVAYAPNTAVARLTARRLAEPYLDSVPSFGFGVGPTAYIPLGRLTTVEQELQAINKNINNLTLYYGELALRRHLLELKGEVGVLHFACHGEFDNNDPLLSRLYLADGPVYAYELLQKPLRPYLVVLSACETAVHIRQAGDEIFGLVRPFLGQGAGGVLATLWKVADVSTSELVESFYTEWNSNYIDPSICLRNAQLKLLHSEKYSHPHYWAPYIFVGSHPI